MHDILICACLKVGREADRSHKNKVKNHNELQIAILHFF